MGREREVGKALERLHLDHERPLHATCHRWRAAPRSWDDGLDGAALCHARPVWCVCGFGGSARPASSSSTQPRSASTSSWQELLARESGAFVLFEDQCGAVGVVKRCVNRTGRSAGGYVANYFAKQTLRSPPTRILAARSLGGTPQLTTSGESYRASPAVSARPVRTRYFILLV